MSHHSPFSTSYHLTDLVGIWYVQCTPKVVGITSFWNYLSTTNPILQEI